MVIPAIRENVPLAPLTTIGLGGPARLFATCTSIAEMVNVLKYARQRDVRVHILGGGSNTIFPDTGFDGLVMHVALRGIEERLDAGDAVLTVSAGESWDGVVAWSVQRGYGGLECLSGIPGSAGATPIQNVGAYGQEVQDTAEAVSVIDRSSGELREIPATECAFGYRRSRFKHEDAARFIVIAVRFRLKRNARPLIRYPELEHQIDTTVHLADRAPGFPALSAVREAVLMLRRTKAMVIDLAEPDSRSVGSFFLNPVVPVDAADAVERRWRESGGVSPLPRFDSPAGVKIPAAWLVEQSGFSRGFSRGGARISRHHALALVNAGGTTRDILSLAEEIRTGVHQRFGLLLQMEPVVVR